MTVTQKYLEQIINIHKQAMEALDGDMMPLHYGAAHVVWEDGNLDSAEWCLDHLGDYASKHTVDQMMVVKHSLQELCKIPLDIRKQIQEQKLF